MRIWCASEEGGGRQRGRESGRVGRVGPGWVNRPGPSEGERRIGGQAVCDPRVGWAGKIYHRRYWSKLLLLLGNCKRNTSRFSHLLQLLTAMYTCLSGWGVKHRWTGEVARVAVVGSWRGPEAVIGDRCKIRSSRSGPLVPELDTRPAPTPLNIASISESRSTHKIYPSIFLKRFIKILKYFIEKYIHRLYIMPLSLKLFFEHFYFNDEEFLNDLKYVYQSMSMYLF